MENVQISFDELKIIIGELTIDFKLREKQYLQQIEFLQQELNKLQGEQNEKMDN